MNFNELLRRANLEALETYILHGDDNMQKPNEKKYAERLEEARKKAVAFFESRYSDIQEYDEIAGYFDEQAAVFQEVYFEIGLITGAKIAYTLRGRMEELK